jgi:drug/metabolite transporter (DMT)-like permease
MQYFLIIFNIFLISAAQLLLKQGSNNLSSMSFSHSAILNMIYKMLNPYILSGAVAYFLSFMLWIYILSKHNVSFVYPLMSLSYVAVMILSVYFLEEKVSFYQWLGVLLIISGTAFIFYKH